MAGKIFDAVGNAAIEPTLLQKKLANMSDQIGMVSYVRSVDLCGNASQGDPGAHEACPLRLPKHPILPGGTRLRAIDFRIEPR
jgi:hypothetical protein